MTPQPTPGSPPAQPAAPGQTPAGPSKVVTVLESLAVLGAVIGPQFFKSQHGQGLLAEIEQSLMAEMQIWGSQGKKT
jgi:hypothetical protein